MLAIVAIITGFVASLRLRQCYESRLLIPSQGKVHHNLCFDFDRLIVQPVGPVAPLANGFQSSPRQVRASTDYPQIFDLPGPADQGLQYDRSLGVSRNRQTWIDRLYFLNQSAFMTPPETRVGRPKRG